MYVVAQLLSGVAVTSKIPISTELSTLIGASKAFQILSNVGLVSTIGDWKIWLSYLIAMLVYTMVKFLNIRLMSTDCGCGWFPYVTSSSVPLWVTFTSLLESVNIKCKSGRAKILGTLVCIGGALLLTLYKGKPLFNYASATSIEKTGTSSSSGRWTIGVVALILGTLFCHLGT
ncbi:WAT1-related protein At3g30340-like [Arachis hypogaea]|uniref:WAT1-related protein At3g30340-like n=1 Tax=Arachis hypogaea TaxID=3818 RepID=UPI003B2244D9